MKRLISAVLLCLLVLPQPAAAWDAFGHEVIARIAWSYLTPQARRAAIALLEQAVRQARANGSEVPFFNLGGGQTVSGKVAALGADSLTLAIGKVEYHLRVDGRGRLLGARIPAQDVTVERIGN